jgi:hypothetical protein
MTKKKSHIKNTQRILMFQCLDTHQASKECFLSSKLFIIKSQREQVLQMSWLLNHFWNVQVGIMVDTIYWVPTVLWVRAKLVKLWY